MPFSSGGVSFSRLLVNPGPDTPTRSLGLEQLETLSEHRFEQTDLGIPLETESGWTTSVHLMDTAFDYDKVVYADGGIGLFGLRIDTNKVPADVKKAVRTQHEVALAKDNPSGFLSKRQKTEAKELAEHELHEHLAQGRYRRSKMTELLWDVSGKAVLTAGSAERTIEVLSERWRATWGGGLSTASAGTLAHAYLAGKGLSRDYEDLRPSAFTAPPPGAGSRADEVGEPVFGDDPLTPEVPWASGGPEPRDFLGNEMLIWLWYMVDQHEGLIELRDEGQGVSEIALLLDRSLEMECGWGISGKQSLRDHAGGTAPIRMAEAADALATGKWPRKAGLVLADGAGAGDQFTLTLQADRWLVSAAKLPHTEQEFETARELAEWRLEQVTRLDGLLLRLLHTFLDLRCSDRWPTQRTKIREWIKANRKKRAGVGAPAQLEAKPAQVSGGVEVGAGAE